MTTRLLGVNTLPDERNRTEFRLVHGCPLRALYPFEMYHSDLTDFCSTKTAPGRDFTDEILRAARSCGLKVGLYHSLNNWFDQPDAVGALEDKAAAR